MASVAAATLGKGEKYGLDGLTPKQYRFATLAFSGLSYTDAYRAAYDCAGSAPGTIGTAANELASNPVIQAKIRELRSRSEAQSTLSAGLSRDFVLNGLMGLAVAADKDSVRLGALQTLGKTVGIDLFRETVRHETVSRSVEDVEQELKQKLDALRDGLTIEGQAKAVPAEQQPTQPRDRRRKPVK